MKKLIRILRSPYIIFGAIMMVWILFFDTYNLMRRFRDKQELGELEQERNYYLQESEKVKHSMDELFSNQATLEKFARERYFMKREGEEIFIVE